MAIRWYLVKYEKEITYIRFISPDSTVSVQLY